MPYSILVNTCDKFSDTWKPFFKLFTEFWPDYKGKVYLNTDYADFTYENVDIISVKNAIATRDADKIAWGECLKRALDRIDDDIILYMQEDYFLKDKVKNDVVNHFAEIIANDDIDCLHLTDQNSVGPFDPSPYEDLWIIAPNAPFRLSCQAALWKKSALKEYIRGYENPWQFEFYGTKRSSILNRAFYTVNRDIYKLDKNEIIPYIFTGVVQGRWKEPVVALFAEHDIEMDYSKRGFVSDARPSPLWLRLRKRIKAIPVAIKSSWELLKMKISIK